MDFEACIKHAAMNGRCAGMDLADEGCGRGDKLVRKICSGACVCISWPRAKENLLALAPDGLMQFLAFDLLRLIRQI
jgi:hypothetical protein